jgi:hypothetical protein
MGDGELIEDIWRVLVQPQIGRAIYLLRQALGHAGHDLPREEFAARLAAIADRYSPADSTLIWRWETGRTTPQRHYRSVLAMLTIAETARMDATTRRTFLQCLFALSTIPMTTPDPLAALGVDPDDVPDPRDIEAAVIRLRRSYSTTPPAELQERVEVRLRQIRQLLRGETRGQVRRDLLEGSGWLALLRATVQADQSQYEDAETSVRVARQIAQDTGQRDLEAWTWETSAWMATTDGRHCDARDLASAGMQVAPIGGYGLVAVTMQRARVNGTLRAEADAVRDLLAGERALAAVPPSEFLDDHYVVDGAKAAFFASGTMAQLGKTAETIEHAAEVVRASEDRTNRNYWPMRVANARVEWAMALAASGDEDAAVAMAIQALDPEWLRPDTERRIGVLLSRMRDPRLAEELLGRLMEAQSASRKRAR